MTRGAPPKNKAKLVEQILTAVREGATLRTTCKKLNVPERTVRGWRQADDEFDDNFFKARIDGTQAKLDVYEDALVEAKESGDRNKILAADKLLGHARWEAEKLLVLYQPEQKSQEKSVGYYLGWLPSEDEEAEDDSLSECGIDPDPYGIGIEH